MLGPIRCFVDMARWPRLHGVCIAAPQNTFMQMYHGDTPKHDVDWSGVKHGDRAQSCTERHGTGARSRGIINGRAADKGHSSEVRPSEMSC